MPRGGSRFGAGRPRLKAKDSECLKIDARHFKRAGVLSVGVSRSWVWSCPETGAQKAAIGFRVAQGAVHLDFQCAGQPVNQRVNLMSTACHLGGARSWFACPCCGRRVAVLFLRWRRFACRRCNQVAYRSQSEDACGRSWIKQRRIEARLGPEATRPRYMRQSTYERLLLALDDCEAMRQEWLEEWADRLWTEQHRVA